jgi:signal recognition particle subunit SRP54
MFDNLSDKMLASIKKIRGQNKITETNIEETLREIRLNLLEADVNFKVVKSFIDRVKTKALGAEVLASLNPGQQFVNIVHQELIQTLGGQAVELNCREKLSTLMLVGLQGAGKTTSAAKLALYIRQKLGKKPGLVPADIYRPAAIDQLQTLAKSNGIPVFPSRPDQKPEEIVVEAQKWAAENMIEVLIVDTAGRLQIDDALMSELERVKEITKPQEILLVADAMLGQQAVNVAEGFHGRLGLTGLVLTKVDGDARGGAALSIREVTGIPIKFLGVGEKVAALEVFHPDRLAGRILDMGDVLTLVERAKDVIDEKSARDSARKMMKNEFSLEDFLAQIQTLKKLGGFESMMKFLPGMGQLTKQMEGMAPPDGEIKKIEAIIQSMTIQERRKPEVLNASRRERIAMGSGTQVQDINKLVRQFEQAKKMMSGMMKMGMGKGGRGLF